MSRKLKKKAVLKKPGLPPAAALKKALELHQQGRLPEAAVQYRRALAAQPKNKDALNLFGALLLQQGEPRKGLGYLKKAVKLAPDNAGFLVNLGSAHLNLNELNQAANAFRKALSLNGNLIQALFNLATALERQGLFVEAAEYYRKSAHRQPAMLEATHGLARCLRQQGKLDEALGCWQKIAAQAPDQALPKAEIADLYREQGNDQEALEHYRQALDRDPNLAEAHNNMGNILSDQGRLHEALDCYQQAVRCAPGLEQATVNLAWGFKEHGMLEETISCLKDFLAVQPEAQQTHSDLLFYMNYPERFTPKELCDAAGEWWQRHGKGIKREFDFRDRKTVCTNRPLRLGFLSPDFRSHPVGTFFLPFIKALDHSRFQVTCYANQSPAQADHVTEAIIKASDNWYYVAARDDEQTAAQIYQDKIDILIDLAGHSANNRLAVLCRRPAPVQVNWLGYVNTTGLPVIDYRFTDRVTDPPELETPSSEQIYRLPETFFCYIPPSEAPKVTPSPCLESESVTFGSFNNIAKLTDQVISSWAAILTKVDRARLILVGRQFGDEEITKIFRRKFLTFQVREEQLEFRANQPMDRYLAMHSEIDICLDPFPHNGHTITCHTLWMGVPVVVLRGDRYAARMGASVLTALDLEELIAEDLEAYVAKTVQLARHPEQLEQLRQGMRTRIIKSPICDTASFGRDFGVALDEIWQRWCLTG